MTSLPPIEIAPLMRFIAAKTKNVTSPMSMRELARQFKEETGSLVVLEALGTRIRRNRQKIHGMNEFSMETKVKMIFALSASIDGVFLEELKKVAEVELDDQQRITRYKQKYGGLELNGKHLKVPMTLGEQRNKDMIQFLAEKSKTTDKPVPDRVLLREFKEETGCTDAITSLEYRYRRVKNRIYHSSEFDKNTRIKMMFISHAQLSDEILEELREDADVEVDEEGRIKKYKSKDGSLELEGSHGMSSITKSFWSDRWRTICEKVNENESEEDDDEATNYQKDYETKRIDLVRFLIERTKNATSPLKIYQLAKDYKAEFKSAEPPGNTVQRIRSFRQRIHKMNQFDKTTKVKMMFALSASVDADFLQKLRKNAVVKLDENQKIKKYKCKDGSLELKGNHSHSAKTKAGLANRKTARVVNDPSESEDDEDEEDSSDSDGSDEEDDGENVGDSTKSKQTPTTSSARKSDRLRKSKVSFQNQNKKRQLQEKDSTRTRNRARLSRGKKRTRISYSSSEASENDEESMALENDPSMDSETTNNVHNGGDDFDYDAPINNHYDENLEHNVNDPNSERNIATPEVTDDVEEEGKEEEEGPSATSSAEIESMSLLELLNHLRPPIVQYTPTLVPRIDENIKKLESEDQQIPFNIIIESLEMCIQMLNTPDEMDPDENKTSLPDFFYRLGMAICNIPHSTMDGFYIKIKKLATTGDEKVSMEHIRYAMGKTLDKILH